VLVIALLLTLALAPPSSASRGEWPTFQANYQRTGHVDTALPKDLELLWRFETPEGVIRGVAAAYGKVYFTSRDNYVYAVYAENGGLAWRYKTGWISSPSLGPVPTVTDGKVFVGAWDDYLYCLNAENGEFLWRFYTGRPGFMSGTDTAPIVIDNRVYFGSWNGWFYALDANTGELIWSFSDGNGKMGHVWESVAYAGGKIFFSTGAGGVGYTGWVYALNAEDGSLIWKFKMGDESSVLAVVDNKVFVGAGYMGHLPGDGVYAFDMHNGRLIWYLEMEHTSIHSLIVVRGRVIFGVRQGKVYALCADNGSIALEYNPGSWPYLAAAGDVVYVLDDYLTMLNAEDGSLVGSIRTLNYRPFQRSLANPTIAYGKLFFVERTGVYSGALVALGPVLTQPSPPWELPYWLPGLVLVSIIVAAVALVCRFAYKRLVSAREAASWGYCHSTNS